MTVRAKFECWSVGELEGENVHVEFNAVTNEETEENKMFWKYTPSGQIYMDITNPAAYKQFEVGKQYYIDFTEVDKGE